MNSANVDVVSKWVLRIPNKRSKDCSWSTGTSLIIEDKAIYSYGHHFCVARYLGTDMNNKPTFLLNADRWRGGRGVTNGHCQYVRRVIEGKGFRTITLSFSALNEMGYEYRRLTLDDIVDVAKAQKIDNIYYDAKKNQYFHYHVKVLETPLDGELIELGDEFISIAGELVATETVYNDDKTLRYKKGYWHIVESVLLKLKLIKWALFDGTQRNATYYVNWLSAVDEGSYFISELSDDVRTISQAFQSLKPVVVRNTTAKWQRQGEWFFVDSGMTWEEYRIEHNLSKNKLTNMSKKHVLPIDRNGSNRHICKMILNKDAKFEEGHTLCFGTVKHVNSWNQKATHEHANLELGDRLYYCYKNTETKSRGANGKID